MKPHVLIEGWMWLAGAAFLTMVTPAYLKGNKIIFFMVVLVDIVLWLIVTLDTGVAPDPLLFKELVAYLLLAVGIMGIYLCAAVLVNTVFGKVVFPMPAPFVK
jgi:uncharacterized protein